MGNFSGSLVYKFKHRISGKSSFSKRSSSTGSLPTIENAHLETFLLVWLDPKINTSQENIQTQKRLREILTCLITFDNVETCESWLKKCCATEKIILIVSGAYGEEIVPRIHHLETIVTIHVYCRDVDRNKPWAKNFSKIHSVKSSTNELLQSLSENQINLESLEDSKALTIYQSEEQVTNLDSKMASFLSYQLLLEILLSPNYMPSKGTFHELIQILRQYNVDDEYGSKLIEEFEETYKPENAVSWLTRDTPLARFVNKALREQDINMLFALRFLLVDIRTQLVERQTQSINVFKIQPMLRSELEYVKANPGHLLLINGFLFVSNHKPELMSMTSNNDQFETVLFDIQADFRQDVAPFAFLRHINPGNKSDITREVLFMCGSIFEVGPLLYENSIWRLQLRLAGENNSPVLLRMKQKLEKTHNFCLIGDLFNQSNQAEKATLYYQRLLIELPKQHSSIPQINRQLSKTNSKPDLPSITNFTYILLNLFKHMSEFSSAVLAVLSSLTSKVIFTIDDESMNDFSQWSNSTNLIIFTTAQFASSIKNFPKNSKIFLLDTNAKAEDPQRFMTIDDMICQLADEIIQKYRLQGSEYMNSGNPDKAAEQDKYANRIYQELRKIEIPEAAAAATTNKATSLTAEKFTAPLLIWLLSESQSDEEDISFVEKTFGDYFSSYLTFFDKSEFHLYLAKEENSVDLFLIISSDYSKSVIKGSRSFPTVQYIYRYGEPKTSDNKILTNRNDLGYHLTVDLITYYGNLGEQYRTNRQLKYAQAMFSKARTLCQILSEKYFSSE